MAIELPSLPKSIVFNSSMIAAIALSALIALVFLWQFLPVLMDVPVPANITAELKVDFTYQRTVAPGDDWQLNGTAKNPSDETVNNIVVRVLSDSNVQGADYNIPFLEPGATKGFTISTKIRDAAYEGETSAKALVSVGADVPAEYEIPLTIKRE